MSKIFGGRLPAYQKVITALILSLIFSGVGSFHVFYDLVTPLENRAIDYWFLIRGDIGPSQAPVVIVMIDEDSAMAYGYRSPTPRRLLADLIDTLIKKKAKVIGVDVLIDRPSNYEDEAQLLASLQRASKSVILVTKPADAPTDSNQSGKILPIFADFVEQGHSEVKTGEGDITRWLRIGSSNGVPSFVAAIFYSYTNRWPGILSPAESFETPIWLRLNFIGTPSRLTDSQPGFTLFTANEIKQIPDSYVQDKIVLIGSGIEDLGDTHLTPFSLSSNQNRLMFGVELHALALDMIFNENYFIDISIIAKFAYYFGLLLIFGIGFFFLKPVLAVVTLLIGLVIVVSIPILAFLESNILVPVVVPVILLIAIFALVQIITNSIEQKYSRFLKKSFKRYISPELVDQLIKDPQQLDLGGQSKRLTIFFSDMAGFTSFSETRSPHEIVSLLNEYFGKMTDILFEEQGTLDKFEGDAIMAFFNAPVSQESHSIHACRAALKMQDAIKYLSTQWQERGLPPFRVRMGIHTGEVVVGNIGSKNRIDYTVIGDPVNLASRLEGVNKIFGTKIIISEETYLDTDDRFITRELGRVL